MEKIKLNIQLFAEQTLETKITSESKELDQSLDNVIKKLNQLATSINKVNNMINKSNTKKVAKDADDFANKIGKSVLSAQKLSNALSFTAITAGITRLVNLIDDWVYEASDYSEQLNLFNVIFNNIEKNGKTTFSNLGKSATQFQYKLNESFGTNKTETFYMQGMFQAMGEAVKIPEEYSAIMSETMTKLSYDMASLYNKQETDTAEALRAGVYAGQTKPLRSYGIDVTQMSMQPVLNDLGIDKTIKQLSQAEKEIVRYLATLRQATNAMGDFANTIESPANQLKVFKQQLVETKVAITSLIMNIASGALPYLNAFLMIVKEIAKWLATLLGIELSSYNSSIANYSYDLEDVGDSADDANKSIAKLKRQALGFDEIHNINENTGNNSGIGSTGGIDQKLLDAIYGYDNGMESVRMKATEIRDKIMEWLGFTKIVNQETNEISFKLKDGFSNLKLIAGIITFLTSLKLFKGIKGLVTGTSTLGKALGTGGLYTSIKKLIKPIKELGAKEGLQKIFIVAKEKLATLLPKLGKFAGVLAGIVMAIKGTGGVNEAMKEFAKSTDEGNKSLADYYKNALLTIGGLALAGGVIGGLPGALIGVITGSLVTAVSAIKGFKDGLKSVSEETKSSFNEIEEPLTNFTRKIKELEFNFSLEITDETQNSLLSSLDNLTKKMSEKINTSKEQTIEDINSLVEEGLLTPQEMKTAKTRTEKYYENISKSTDIAKKKIKSIIEKANKENRALEESEMQEITNLYELLKNNTISIVTTSQTEQSILLEQFADTKKQISKEVASQMISDAIAIKDEAIKNAEEQYTETLNKAQNMYQIGAINEETYNKIKDEAKNTRDDTIAKAQEQYNTIYNEFEKNHEDIAKYIDNDDGHVKSGWEVFWDGMGETVSNWWTTAMKFWKEKWNELKTWWSTDAKPKIDNAVNEVTKYFTKEYWSTKWENIKTSFNEGLQKVKDKFDTKMSEWKTWMDNHLFKYFTKEYWTGKLANIKTAVNEFKFPKIKLSVSYDTNVGKAKKAVYEALGLDGWPKLKFEAYANGGIPSKGSMFVAGEAGAEIVGNINGRTEVLNKSQIASAIYSAVLSAMNQVQTSNQIDVHVHTDEGTIVDRVNQKTKQTGVFPFHIPV